MTLLLAMSGAVVSWLGLTLLLAMPGAVVSWLLLAMPDAVVPWCRGSVCRSVDSVAWCVCAELQGLDNNFEDFRFFREQKFTVQRRCCMHYNTMEIIFRHSVQYALPVALPCA